MSYNNPPTGAYTPGINHVGAYQVSGRPFAKGGLTATNTPQKLEFPYVTNWIQIVTHTGTTDDVRFGFSADSKTAGCYFGAHVGNNVNHEYPYPSKLDLKCKEIWYWTEAASTTAEFDIVAGLTSIPASRMYELTGPGIDA
jgi:hypothetical protein